MALVQICATGARPQENGFDSGSCGGSTSLNWAPSQSVSPFFRRPAGKKAAPQQSGPRQSTESGPWPLKLELELQMETGVASRCARDRVARRLSKSRMRPRQHHSALQLERSLDLDKKNGLAPQLGSLQLFLRNGDNAGCSLLLAHLYALPSSSCAPHPTQSRHNEPADEGPHFRWASSSRHQSRQGPAAIDALRSLQRSAFSRAGLDSRSTMQLSVQVSAYAHLRSLLCRRAGTSCIELERGSIQSMSPDVASRWGRGGLVQSRCDAALTVWGRDDMLFSHWRLGLGRTQLSTQPACSSRSSLVQVDT